MIGALMSVMVAVWVLTAVGVAVALVLVFGLLQLVLLPFQLLFGLLLLPLLLVKFILRLLFLPFAIIGAVLAVVATLLGIVLFAVPLIPLLALAFVAWAVVKMASRSAVAGA